MALVSLSDVKDRLGIADASQDAYLTSQINLFTEIINNYCGRVFEATDWVQTFKRRDFESKELVEYLFLYYFPINSIASVKEIYYSASGSPTEETITTYRLNSRVGKLERESASGFLLDWYQRTSYYGEPSVIEVTYNAGYSSIPLAVQEVCFDLIAQQYNKKQAGIDLNFGSDVQRISIPGTVSVDFDYTLQSNERKSAFGMYIGNYSNVLDFYRSERPVVGEINLNYIEESP